MTELCRQILFRKIDILEIFELVTGKDVKMIESLVLLNGLENMIKNESKREIIYKMKKKFDEGQDL